MNIDEAARALDTELLPWQREIGQRLLDGDQVVMVGGRRAGRTTLKRVLDRATDREVCPQPCDHLSQEDAREGRTCAEHPCTCANRPDGSER